MFDVEDLDQCFLHSLLAPDENVTKGTQKMCLQGFLTLVYSLGQLTVDRLEHKVSENISTCKMLRIAEAAS